jgi:hypothetical protein
MLSYLSCRVITYRMRLSLSDLQRYLKRLAESPEWAWKSGYFASFASSAFSSSGSTGFTRW